MIPTAVPKDEQQSFSWDIFDHAAYFPDHTPSDFHTFPAPHDFLGGRWFYDEGSLKKVVTNFFKKKDPASYATGINKLIDQYEKCLTRYGDSWKIGYNLENKVFLIWNSFVDFLKRMNQRCKTFEVSLIVAFTILQYLKKLLVQTPLIYINR